MARYRVGSHYGIHVYEQLGPEVSDEDRPVATFHSPRDAAFAVRAMNHAIMTGADEPEPGPTTPEEYLRAWRDAQERGGTTKP